MCRPHWCVLLTLIVAVSVAGADWEVLNGGDSQSRTEGDVDGFSLKQEDLLPADISKQTASKAKQRNLSSLDQHETDKKHLNVQVASKQIDASTAKPDSSKTEKTITSKQPSPTEKKDSSKSDDVINFAEEGLLSLENRAVPNVNSDRKRAQSKEQSSEDSTLKDSHNSEAGTASQQQKSPKNQQQPGSLSKDDVAVSNFKVACVYEDSWECLMFKEDFLAMQGDANLSRRATAHERTKRQSAPTYRQPLRNSGNTRNLLDCENGECGSGENNITGTDDIANEPLDLQLKGQTRTRRPANITGPLNNATQVALAKELEDKLTEIYKNIPGFQNVSINPKQIHFDSSDNIVYDGWVININASDNAYTNKTGPQVGKIIGDVMKNASDKYKNASLWGQHPLEDFNFTKAINEVINQVDHPCDTMPSQCPFGFSQCRVLPPGYKNMTGINVECTDNCLNFSSTCSVHGECTKDRAGKAYCNCSHNWVGLYCDKANDSKANKDEYVTPNFTVNMVARYNTNLTEADLSPDKRQQIANDFAKQLTEMMKNVPGFVGINVDPNSIVIRDGKLIIPWQMALKAAGSAYTGQTPQTISDTIRDALQSVSGIYKNGTLIGGQPPLDDLDFNDAADQVKNQAQNPCSTKPCSVGYDNCEAVSYNEVKCIHNCNALPGLCMNDGTCQLNGLGNATCQCAGSWTGPNCDSQSQQGQKALDDGKIVGVAVGGALIAAGVIGTTLWFIFCAKRNKNIDFTNYTDQEGSGGNSTPASMFVIDRPLYSPTRLPLFTQSGPNSRNFSRSSSYETPNSSTGSAAGNPTANPHSQA